MGWNRGLGFLGEMDGVEESRSSSPSAPRGQRSSHRRWKRGSRRRGLLGRQEASVKSELIRCPAVVRYESEIEDAISISTELLVVACAGLWFPVDGHLVTANRQKRRNKPGRCKLSGALRNSVEPRLAYAKATKAARAISAG